MPSLSSPSFTRLVSALKRHQKTCTVVESCCGGLINASIMAQPGASAVYFGGSVAYNTRKAKPLLLNDAELHSKLTTPLVQDNAESEKDKYIRSKLEWTKQTATAFCQELQTDYCIAEGGATGPTFRPKGVTTGFAVIAIAAKQPDGQVQVVQQKVIESTHNQREENMKLFASQAADLAWTVVAQNDPKEEEEEATTTHTELHFDRATHIRTDPEHLDQLKQNAQYVVLYKNFALFQKAHQGDSLHNRSLCLLNPAELDALCETLPTTKWETSFLGLRNGKEPVFGVDLLGENESEAVEAAMKEVLNGRGEAVLEDVRTVAPLLNPNSCHNEMVIHATALAQWQRRAPFCAVCGSPTILLEGGTSRQCTGCGHRSWPRQDPSMIAVVSNREGSKVLLGRSARHPAKMHTALAGFVEAGETMERAVAREVYEETGIRVDEETVEYVASQPWPFPQSTMIGFTVQADEDQPLNIDTNELVDAKWFDRSQVMMASKVAGPVMQKDVAEAALLSNPDLNLLIPPKGVLARSLIDKWLLR